MTLRDVPPAFASHAEDDPSDALRPEDEALLRAAVQARRHARAPYSRFLVGSAVRGASGSLYGGCNVESASYPLTCCAERVAVYKALSEGESAFTAVAVLTTAFASPCGGCRQVLFEYGPDAQVLVADLDGRWRRTTTRALLPYGFDGKALL
jgi:cytidine deaminase